MRVWLDKIVVSVAMILTLWPILGLAQRHPPTYREPDGRTWTCYAPHGRTGHIVPVAGMNGFAGGFWGFATYNAQGWPTIIFDVSQLGRFPVIVARFTYYHECAHLSLPTTDEIRANCEGLRQMRTNGDISRRQEDQLRRLHYSLGPLGPQYGGSGRVLWDRTIQCAGHR